MAEQDVNTTEEVKTEPTQEAPEQDLNLEELDISELEASLFEEEGETEEPTEAKPNENDLGIADDEVIEIDGEKIPLKDAILAFKNKSEWQKSNTQKAQEIAEERRRIEEERQRVEEEKQRLQLLMQQQPQAPAQPTEQQQTDYADLGIDLEDLPPEVRVLAERLQKQEQQFMTLQQQLEEQRFIEQSKMQHERLKSTFPDYDPDSVEQAILKGRDPFEDTYKALKYDAIIKGDSEQIKTIIPKQVMEEIKRDVRKQLIEDLRKREKKLRSVSTSTPTGQSLPRMPEKAPHDYNEAKQDILNAIAEEGISLFE